ncbi:hypothetical protein MMC07_001688 [Pseudocyphellaria aurata]|nr:hypothetical protein [Pseudocyphellaria aurata]
MALSPIQSLPVELLETILLQLPIHDLLLSQSVCSRWQATVKDSPKVQEALFLGGKPGSLVVGHLESLVKNPLLYDRFRGWKMLGANDHGDPIIRFRVDDTSLAPVVTRDPPSLQHPSSSWRRMLLTHPPCEDLVFFPASGVEGWDNDSDGEDDTNEEVPGFDRGVHRLHCDGGITMGALTQAVERVYYNQPTRYWTRSYRYTMWVLKFRHNRKRAGRLEGNIQAEGSHAKGIYNIFPASDQRVSSSEPLKSFPQDNIFSVTPNSATDDNTASLLSFTGIPGGSYGCHLAESFTPEYLICSSSRTKLNVHALHQPIPTDETYATYFAHGGKGYPKISYLFGTTTITGKRSVINSQRNRIGMDDENKTGIGLLSV